MLSWQLGEHHLPTWLFWFRFFNLLCEHGFAIVISWLQRALQSELLFSAGSPSYLISRCAQETGFLQGISPGGQTYLLVSLSPWSLRQEALAAAVICHTQNLLSLNAPSCSQGKLPPSQMKGTFYGQVGLADSIGHPEHRLQVQTGGRCPSPAAGRMSPARVCVTSPRLLPAAEVPPLGAGVQLAASYNIVTIQQFQPSPISDDLGLGTNSIYLHILIIKLCRARRLVHWLVCFSLEMPAIPCKYRMVDLNWEGHFIHRFRQKLTSTLLIIVAKWKTFM